MDKKSSFLYSNKDWVFIAIISAISAVAYAGLGQLWAVLTAAFGPLGGAFLGLFQFGHILAFAIIRRPGVAFITSVLSAAVQSLLGDPAGIYVIGWGITHGIGAELIFALYRYKSTSWVALSLAAGVAAIFGHLWSYYLYGWEAAMSLFYVSIPILFLSSAILSGFLVYSLVELLKMKKFIS